MMFVCLVIISFISVNAYNIFTVFGRSKSLHFSYGKMEGSQTKVESLAVTHVAIPLESKTHEDIRPLFDHDRLFKQDPSMRKIAKKYLQKKIFSSEFECYGNCFIPLSEITNLTQRISGVLPRVHDNDINVLAGEICDAFRSDSDTESCINDIEFIDAILSSSQLRNIGELIFKEIIYLDCLCQNGSHEKSFLSEKCFDALKFSLVEEQSQVTMLTASGAKTVLDKLSGLNEIGIGPKLYVATSILDTIF